MKSKNKPSRRHIKLQPFKRKIHFPHGEIWTYRIAGYNISIRNPELNQTYRTDVFALYDSTQREWFQWDVPVEECGSDMEIRGPIAGPGDIKKWIEKNLRHK